MPSLAKKNYVFAISSLGVQLHRLVFWSSSCTSCKGKAFSMGDVVLRRISFSYGLETHKVGKNQVIHQSSSIIQEIKGFIYYIQTSKASVRYSTLSNFDSFTITWEYWGHNHKVLFASSGVVPILQALPNTALNSISCNSVW